MKNNKLLTIFDSLFVLLNIAAGRGCFLGNWLLFTENSLVFPVVVIVLDFIYISVRSKKTCLKLLHQEKYKAPWIIFISLLSYNFVNIFLHVGGLDLPTFEYGLVAFLFFFVFNKQSTTYEVGMMNLRDRVFYLSRGYIWLSMISVLGVFSSFILYSLGLAGDVPITADFLAANEETGNNYTRVFLSVRNFYLSFDDIRVPFFQDKGIFCGLFHEPHIVAYNVFPCLIILLGLYSGIKYKFLIILSSVLMLLFAGSATNALVVLACISIYLIVLGKRNLMFMIFGATIIVIAILIYVSIDDTFYQFIVDRLDGSNASNEYSRGLLGYAFSPESLTGFNFLSTEFMKFGVKPGRDVGYIAFVLNILFLFSYIKNSVILIFKKEPEAVAVGFASLYCILHSAKIGMTIYSQILPVFLVLLQSYLLTYYRREIKSQISIRQ